MRTKKIFEKSKIWRNIDWIYIGGAIIGDLKVICMNWQPLTLELIFQQRTFWRHINQRKLGSVLWTAQHLRESDKNSFVSWTCFVLKSQGWRRLSASWHLTVIWPCNLGCYNRRRAILRSCINRDFGPCQSIHSLPFNAESYDLICLLGDREWNLCVRKELQESSTNFTKAEKKWRGKAERLSSGKGPWNVSSPS